MKINFVIDDQLLAEACLLSKCDNPEEVIEKALKLLVQIEAKKKPKALKTRVKDSAERLKLDYAPGEELTEFTIALDGDGFLEIE